MAVQSESSTEEIKHLQRCINELVSLLALPAIWSGRKPSQILHTLLEAVVRALGLEFAYARLSDAFGAMPVEILLVSENARINLPSEELRHVLGTSFPVQSKRSPTQGADHLGVADISAFLLPLGVQEEIGLLVVGSRRTGFPSKTESLLLTVAANQASLGLHEARLLSEQKRINDELDLRVAERTEQLTAANKELHEARAALQKAFDEIRRSEAKLWRVIDTIPTLAWTMLPDGSNEFLSKKWQEYTGLPIDESRGWGWQVAFHSDDLPLLMKKWRQMLAAEESGEWEARIRRHDGIYRWFLIRASPFRDETGAIVRWYGISTDIEDRKRAEEALLRSEQNLRLIISTIPVLAWSAQADGNVDFLNQRWLDYTGLPPEKGQGWGWAQAFHPDDLGRLNDYWLSIIASGQPGEIEARLRRFDGSYRWFLFRANPLRDESGAIAKWYGTNTDIDDRKRAEEELRNTQAELGRVIRAMTMGQLTASIAHEVNQPLSGIVTNAGTCLRMLDANPPNLEGARETVRRTIRDGKRASDVIMRLRTLYSKTEPTLEPMDLNEATREVIALSLSELQRNRVVLRQELAEDLPLILGDRIQIQQVVLNLMRNGSDAMSSVDDRPRDLLIKTERDKANGVRLSVKDTGVGFDTQSEERLFEAFYTTKNDGMGIGLSVSRSIMESHRGRLWAVRNEGPGATFFFSIPRSTNAHVV
jgi:PAS domain S-box-containing protein